MREVSSRPIPHSCAYTWSGRNPTTGSFSTAKLVPFFAATDSGAQLSCTSDRNDLIAWMLAHDRQPFGHGFVKAESAITILLELQLTENNQLPSPERANSLLCRATLKSGGTMPGFYATRTTFSHPAESWLCFALSRYQLASFQLGSHVFNQLGFVSPFGHSCPTALSQAAIK